MHLQDDTTTRLSHALFLVDRFELDSLVGILPPARRAFLVQVLLNVMPAKTTDLRKRMSIK